MSLRNIGIVYRKELVDSLRDELQEYLATHARRESYVLLSPPRVKFETDSDLDLGVFGIATSGGIARSAPTTCS